MQKIIIVFILLISQTISAQNDSSTFQLKVNVDIASRYIWRGCDYFNSPAIQLDMEAVYKNKIGMGAWGSISFAQQPIQENNFFVFANIGHFSVYVYDYFFMNQSNDNHYFNYNDKQTGHTLSTDVSYTISEKIPLTFLASYNFWGNDTLHSNYIELSYSLKKQPIKLFCGATFDKGWYGNGPGVVNTGIQFSRSIKITNEFDLPLDIQCIINPQKENIFIVALIHL
ncbi:MAG: hypothetical protein Fur0028_10320 [Bacteroidales bacterium]